MQNRTSESQYQQEDEMDLKQILLDLFDRKWFIFGLTSFVTVLGVIYALNQTPVYKATSSFISPSQNAITTINKLNLTAETKKSVFSSFLNNLSSPDFQKNILIENDVSTIFNKDNKVIGDVGKLNSGITNSISVNQSELTENNNLTETPYSVSIEGDNAAQISEYLNKLVELANSKTINALIKLNELKISNRLEVISLERDLLLEKAKRDRLNQIERIKEEDAQKIRQINGQIEALRIKAKRDRLNQIERIKEEDAQKIRQINDKIDGVRYQANENRLNQIVVLIEAAKLAKSLGIIENNFKLVKGDGVSSDFGISIRENEDLPAWYLYGEKALTQRVELLQNRTRDDSFIPELVTLNNQLNEVQNNNLLKTLETRQGDDPFIPEIVALQMTLKEVQNNNLLKTLETRQGDDPFITEITELDVEKIKLESSVVEMIGVSAMQLTQISTPPLSPFKPNRKLIILFSFIAGLILSIFLSFIMIGLKESEDEKNHSIKSSKIL